MWGFPIRTSADRGLVDGSPQLFAVTHVLHRFLAPRHPPLALCSLEYLFRSFFRTCSFSRAGRSRQTRTRCSCLLCSSQGATVTHAERRSRRSMLDAAASEGSLSDSFKTEEKTVSRRRLTREEGPNPLRPSRSWPTAPPVHQLGVSRSAPNVCRWTVREDTP